MENENYNIELFSAAPTHIVDDIKRYGKAVIFRKNMPAMHSDDINKYFYFIIEGRIKVYQFNMETAKEQIIKILTKGDMFDVIVLLDNKPHNIMTEAYEDTKALRVPLEMVRKWVQI